MKPDSGIQACAVLVQKGDPERFRATMAAPVTAREVLFPVHAFCLEVAKAPWITQENMIAEMRLQFWRDVLQEKIDGKAPRAHEVARPLAMALDDEAAAALDATVVARQWDIYRDPHDDEAALVAYLTATYATPLVQAARLLGAPRDALGLVGKLAYCGALARYFSGVPGLQEHGRVPLVDGRPAAVAALAREALDAVSGCGGAVSRLGKTARAPLIDAVTHLPVLRQAARDPQAVVEGRLGLTPLKQSLRLAAVSQAPSWAFL